MHYRCWFGGSNGVWPVKIIACQLSPKVVFSNRAIGSTKFAWKMAIDMKLVISVNVILSDTTAALSILIV